MDYRENLLVEARMILELGISRQPFCTDTRAKFTVKCNQTGIRSRIVYVGINPDRHTGTKCGVQRLSGRAVKYELNSSVDLISVQLANASYYTNLVVPISSA